MAQGVVDIELVTNARSNALADLLPLAAARISSLVVTRTLVASVWGEYGQLTWLADTAPLCLGAGRLGLSWSGLCLGGRMRHG